MRLSQNAFLLTRARFRQIVKRGTIFLSFSRLKARPIAIPFAIGKSSVFSGLLAHNARCLPIQNEDPKIFIPKRK